MGSHERQSLFHRADTGARAQRERTLGLHGQCVLNCVERDDRGDRPLDVDVAQVPPRLALGRAGVGILALAPELATLEDLFFRLTESNGDGGQARPSVASGPPGDEALVQSR